MKEIRKYFLRSIIFIGKIILEIIYFFMKLLPTKNRIVMLSRQSNKKNIDFRLLENEIKILAPDIEIKILCRLIRKKFVDRLQYCFYILRCMLNIATAKVCILDGYSIPICLLKHKKNLTIIQIWHSSGALKKFGYQSINKKEGRGEGIAKLMNMHKNYDYVIAPSKATADFYKEAFNIDDNKIIICGLPRIDYLFDKKVASKKEKVFFENYPEYKGKKIILYVPTFRKDTDINDNIEEIINCINFEKYGLIIKLHPLDKTTDANKYVINKEIMNTFDLLKVSDYIITDYSALAFEASALNKQLYFYTSDIKNYYKTRGLNINLFKEMNNATSENFNEIYKKIESNDYNFDELEKFRIKYMGNDYKNNTNKLAKFVLKFVKKDYEYEESIENDTNRNSKEKLTV